MGDPVKRLQNFIREYFSTTLDNESLAVTTRKPEHRNRNRRTVAPSERFVWGMVTLIVALIGVIVLEALCIVVTGASNNELLAVISGLVGSLVTAFLMGKQK